MQKRKIKNLSYNLALAIGWTPDKIKMVGDTVHVYTQYELPNYNGAWMIFDYESSDVIYNIATVYDCFPSALVDGDYAKAKANGRSTILEWECIIWSYKHSKWNRFKAKNPQEDVALAIINRDKK